MEELNFETITPHGLLVAHADQRAVATMYKAVLVCISHSIECPSAKLLHTPNIESAFPNYIAAVGYAKGQSVLKELRARGLPIILPRAVLDNEVLTRHVRHAINRLHELPSKLGFDKAVISTEQEEITDYLIRIIQSRTHEDREISKARLETILKSLSTIYACKLTQEKE